MFLRSKYLLTRYLEAKGILNNVPSDLLQRNHVHRKIEKKTKTLHSRVLINRLDLATYILEHQTSWHPQSEAFWKMMSHF